MEGLLPVLGEWLEFAVRWAHVTTAIVWIGTSFYFIALDLGLRRHQALPEGVTGEEWQVHGGGFYHVRKYMVAPAELPEHLTWFKWESYATWVTGFALLCVLYYAYPEFYLVDNEVMELSNEAAIAISVASIVVGWFAYDLICKSRFGDDNTRLMLFLYVVLVAMAWGFSQVFTGRAAFVHLGSITATIMSANVFLVIIPNQRIVTEDLKAGRTPDPKYGRIANQRSTHNNYLTLPVIFLMLSNHYPLAFATEYSWVIASLIFLMGVLIRVYFNNVHARKGHRIWPWLAAAVLFLVIVWLSTMPAVLTGSGNGAAALTPAERRLAASPHFEAVQEAVFTRCLVCHTEEPAWEGIRRPPKGILLETEEQVLRNARLIYLQAGRSRAMPPGNLAGMEDSERRLIVAWYEERQE